MKMIAILSLTTEVCEIVELAPSTSRQHQVNLAPACVNNNINQAKQNINRFFMHHLSLRENVKLAVNDPSPSSGPRSCMREQQYQSGKTKYKSLLYASSNLA
jgi:hypothetical protein